MVMTVGPTAALAGVPSGVQSLGPWTGRRQLFVRFAGEAETATMYTAAALAGELRKLSTRSAYHSVAVGGRDVLGNAEFLAAAFGQWSPTLPVMLDLDGQRPEALRSLDGHFALAQVTLDPGAPAGTMEHAMETLAMAAGMGREHALALVPGEEATDGQLLRAIERAHAASGGTIIVVHPPPDGEPTTLDRRWGTLLEQAMRVHPDTRLLARIPPPVGMR